MFRLQNNVPEVYVQKSRDFQLFCRLYDSVFNGVKYSIDSMMNTSSAKDCNAVLLDLLKTKLGIFADIDLAEDQLRLLLQAFPYIIRHKGSKRGIQYMLSLFHRMNAVKTPMSFEIWNVDSTGNLIYEIELTSDSKLQHDELLLELIKYIIPTGYDVKFKLSTESSQDPIMVLTNTVEIESADDSNDVSTLRDFEKDVEFSATPGINKELLNELTTTMGLTQLGDEEEGELNNGTT